MSDILYTFTRAREPGEDGTPPVFSSEDALSVERFVSMGDLVRRNLQPGFLARMAQTSPVRDIMPGLVAKLVIRQAAESYRQKIEATIQADGLEGVFRGRSHIHKEAIGNGYRLTVFRESHLKKAAAALEKKLAEDWAQPDAQGGPPWFWLIEPLWLNVFTTAALDGLGCGSSAVLDLIHRDPDTLIAQHREWFDQLEATTADILTHQVAAVIVGESLSRSSLDDLEYILALRKAPESPAPKGLSPELNNLPWAPSAPFYQAAREVYQNRSFKPVDGCWWPTATIKKGKAQGSASLMHLDCKDEALVSTEHLSRMAEQMFRQAAELSDSSSDALDLLTIHYLEQSSTAKDDIVADMDEFLRRRGIKPKMGGQGRRGGYEPEQRKEILRACSHVFNTWFEVTIPDGYKDGPGATGKKSRRATKVLRGRPFVMSDQIGQRLADGRLDVKRLLYRPGRGFGTLLHGPGRQMAMLSAKALQYDPYRKTWEKRLARYFSWQWRIRARNGAYGQGYRVSTLLEACGEALNKRRPDRTKSRLETALNTLARDGVIASWHYSEWGGSQSGRQGWVQDWHQSTVTVEPPEAIRDQYDRLRDPQAPQLLSGAAPIGRQALEQRIHAARRKAALTQAQAAERAGVSQQTFSRAENGRHVSLSTGRKIEDWLNAAETE